MKKAQVLLGILGMILIFFGFLLIILLNIINVNYDFGYIFRRTINLRSIEISGLRYALYQINKNPNFVTTSSTVNLPHGYFVYSVQTTTNTNLRLIRVDSYLTTTPPMSKTLTATATINASGTILNLEVSN